MLRIHMPEGVDLSRKGAGEVRIPFLWTGVNILNIFNLVYKV